MFENTVNDAGAVETGHSRQPPRDGAGCVVALFLHPAHVELDVGAGRIERVDGVLDAPAQIGAQVAFGVDP
jgi:hypothetical protein